MYRQACASARTGGPFLPEVLKLHHLVGTEDGPEKGFPSSTCCRVEPTVQPAPRLQSIIPTRTSNHRERFGLAQRLQSCKQLGVLTGPVHHRPNRGMNLTECSQKHSLGDHVFLVLCPGQRSFQVRVDRGHKSLKPDLPLEEPRLLLTEFLRLTQTTVVHQRQALGLIAGRLQQLSFATASESAGPACMVCTVWASASSRRRLSWSSCRRACSSCATCSAVKAIWRCGHGTFG